MPAAQTALLVIDMQNDFVEESALFEVPDARSGLPGLAAFIADMRARGVPVCYTRHTYDPSDNVVEAEMFPNLAEGGLREGSRGWDIHPSLAPTPEDVVIDKPRYDAFYRTNLDDELRARGTTHLLIVGTMTEVCCESTARAGMVRDYRVTMVRDLNFSRAPEKHAATLATFASHFGQVHSSTEVRSLLV